MKRAGLLCILVMVLISGCTSIYYRIPVEGRLENFTVFDILVWTSKSILGPVRFADSHETASLSSDFVPRPEDTALTVSMIGDIMFHPSLMDNPQRLYEYIPEDLFDTDIRFGNLEFPIHPGRPPRGFPRFNGTSEYFAKIVLPMNLNVINLANNHCLDQGIDGLLATAELLENYSIKVLGIKNACDRYILLEIDGLTVAMSGYTFSTNGVFVEGDSIVNRANLNAWNISDANLDDLLRLVDRMSDLADIVIMSLHWGYELELYPRSNQVVIARTLADRGVDLIIGHHPHVLQPVEVYETEDGRLSTIVYSLGNWTTSMHHRATRTTAVMKVALDASGQITELEECSLLLDLGIGQFVPDNW